MHCPFRNQMNIESQDIERFQKQGFLIVPDLIDLNAVEALRQRFPFIFSGKFDTGVYPDEWYWREGMSLPDITRHMGNVWKSDLTIAKLVLSTELARAATLLTGWSGVRLGQDTIWWKTPKSKAIALHQDTSFMDFLDPAQTITCWITLDETSRHTGTLEYMPGSHRWPLTELPDDFHAPDNYRARMEKAAQMAGLTNPETVFVEVPPGSVAFHAGETWHGSASNDSDDRMRRSIGIHYLPVSAKFSDRPGGYIYRRYQLSGSDQLDESFFPVLWNNNGALTPWLQSYLSTGRRI
ncbi:MAG: phytanoyl-CoA dioxygenase family protein [Candidatus Melainabacteria bacterium]|nr:MAG: phytanoyl-CoA dioxygenase family protein [Candidatus Melainabacteria bacterium]